MEWLEGFEPGAGFALFWLFIWGMGRLFPSTLVDDPEPSMTFWERVYYSLFYLVNTPDFDLIEEEGVIQMDPGGKITFFARVDGLDLQFTFILGFTHCYEVQVEGYDGFGFITRQSEPTLFALATQVHDRIVTDFARSVSQRIGYVGESHVNTSSAIH